MIVQGLRFKDTKIRWFLAPRRRHPESQHAQRRHRHHGQHLLPLATEPQPSTLAPLVPTARRPAATTCPVGGGSGTVGSARGSRLAAAVARARAAAWRRDAAAAGVSPARHDVLDVRGGLLGKRVLWLRKRVGEARVGGARVVVEETGWGSQFGKRVREAPKRFEAAPVASKKRAKQTKEKSAKESKSTKKNAPAPGSRIGQINPRTGKPYSRKPYKPEAAAEFVTSVLNSKKPPKTPKPNEKMQGELVQLAGKLADALQKLQEETAARQAAEAKLAAKETQVADAVAIAVKDERISNLGELHTQFMDGMKHGAMMARGDMSALMQPPPRPAVGSSTVGSSTASTSESPALGLFGRTPVPSAFDYRPTP